MKARTIAAGFGATIISIGFADPTPQKEGQPCGGPPKIRLKHFHQNEQFRISLSRLSLRKNCRKKL
jgi:hypothetical protein